MKELLLIGSDVLCRSSHEVVDPRIAAQVLWLVAEPRLACTEVSKVTQRLYCWPKADVANGGFRERA